MPAIHTAHMEFRRMSLHQKIARKLRHIDLSSVKKLPRAILRRMNRATFKRYAHEAKFITLRGILRVVFRPGWVEHGMHQPQLPGGVYIVNHASWADGFILAVLLEKEFRYSHPDFAVAVNIRHQHKISTKLLQKLVNVLFFDPAKADASSNILLADVISAGGTVILQPEGRPTDTGIPLPPCETLAGILAETQPLIHSLYIEGTQNSLWSAVKPKQAPTRLWPKVTLHLFPTLRLNITAGKGRVRSEQAATQLSDLLADMTFRHQDHHQTLFSAIIGAAKQFGGRHIVCEDTERQPLRYRKLLAGSFILGGAIDRELGKDEHTVGLMLPNVNGALVAFAGLQAYGITTAMMNFTAGRHNICAAAATAGLRTIITSRRFVKMAEMEAVINALVTQGQRILYLEDLRGKIGTGAKLCGLLKAFRPRKTYERLHRHSHAAFDADATAIILFTSGSEGAPKGVALTHGNIVSNIAQLRSCIDVGTSDCLFNPLPIFHTSGLTVGYILPLLSGVKLFLYPSPLHYQTIPELISDTRATILFATDTFLNGYARYARPYDLHRLRYAFAGAEKLREETRRLWAERFGVRVFEGYGVTETSPVLAFNSPMFCKPGTVGRFVPGMLHTLAPVEGIEEGGRLKVTGPNIMAGYILADQPGVLRPPEEGWHDTGDIVSIDESGFITIVGRAKRFAKIGGEMVSLAGVESLIAQLWPEHDHAVVARPDPRKGEQLVLVTTRADAAREALLTHFREQGITELSLPKHIMVVEALPILGSGKTDYPAVGMLVLAEANTAEAE
ncbi:MAG: AMP-binding protein [Alphaproteobacteria bacterium]|nr:AMP-binding protein [Alphaproteobacteria bacterium]